MSSTYLSDALSSLAQSAQVLDSLPFHRTQILPRTVLSDEDFFESRLIRDAAPHELALFQPNQASGDYWATEPDEPAAQDGERWIATKRKAPKRVDVGKDKASPLKERQRPPANPVDDADRCLRAAKKLLEIYSMPRAQEHVEALHSQWTGLISSITSLEESLRRPPSRSAAASASQHDETYYRTLALEDQIKREQLELFALEQLKSDKEAEVRPSPYPFPSPSPRLTFPIQLAALRPPTRPPPGPAARKVPSVVARSGASARQPRPKPAPRPAPPPEEEDPAFDPFKKSSLLEEERASPSAGPRSPPPEPATVSAPALTRYGRPSVPSAVPTPRATPRASVPTAPQAAPASAESTPRASRLSPSPSPARLSPTPNTPRSPPAPSLPPGVTPSELSAIVKNVWKLLAEGLRPWARKWVREEKHEEAGEVSEAGLNFEETLSTLRTILATAFPSPPPSSPSASISSFATSQAVDDAAEPSPPTQATTMEFKLLELMFSALSSTPLLPPASPSSSSAVALPELAIILRDPVLPTTSSLSSPSSAAPPTKTPCLSMAALKAHLGAFAKQREWTEEMGTTAIYALVSKQVARIDRRGREGAVLCFRT
ncbi:hypothetical protein JCM1840_001790 [Sporobolomyces johnsonii]